LLALGCLFWTAACGEAGEGPPPGPAITSFTAAPSTLTTGTAATLTAVFANGTGSVDNGVGALVSGIPKSTGALEASTTFTLTVSGEGASLTRTVTVTVVPAPTQPVITAPSILTAGATGSASVPDQAGMTFEWTITGGSFSGGSSNAAGTAVTFTAGEAGVLRLACTATNAAGTGSVPAVEEVTVVAAPVISGFAAAASPITAGGAASLVATFTGGTGTVDRGVGTVVSGIPAATGNLDADTPFTLTVTNAAGDAVTAQTTVEVVAPPVISGFTAARSPITAGGATTLLATFTGGTGTVDHGVGAVLSGIAASTGDLSADTLFTLTVANAAGDAVTAQATVEVVAPPVISGFTAAAPAITAGSATTLVATFTGGTGTVDHGIGTVASGVPAGTGSLLDTTTFLLTVTNAAGDSVSAQTTVSLVIVFTSEGDTFAPVIVVDGSPAILWTFADGTTSTSRTPSKVYGSAGSRLNTLTVTPWAAVRRINLGYFAADGGSPSIELVPDQHVSAVEGLAVVRSTLGQWCSSYNDFTSLDFSNFANLDTVDCYHCENLASVNLANTPRLSRVSFEACHLASLDVSQSPMLADLRAALNAFPTVGFGSGAFPDVWHICVRDNPQLTDRGLFATTARFPNLAGLLIWNDNQAGELRIPSSHPTADFELEANDNSYTSLDLEGALRNPLARGVVSLDRNPITHVNLTGCVQLTELYLQRTALSEGEQDAILATLDALGRARLGPGDPTPLVVDLQGNVSPSAAGRAHAVSLASRGWTVTTSYWTEAPP
jgi:hypothetical protein